MQVQILSEDLNQVVTVLGPGNYVGEVYLRTYIFYSGFVYGHLLYIPLSWGSYLESLVLQQ